jgi:hypothetical protein
MRYFIVLILFACSQTSWKYKYSSSKKYLASLTREDSVVKKIVVQPRDPLVFASGMDSTFVTVKLYDSQGELLTDVDPYDLTLSSNVDVEAKPFTLKQGVYKAEILPRVKSPSITMQVDWQEKVASESFTIATTKAPVKDKMLPVSHEFWETKSFGEVSISRGSASLANTFEGFSFENLGDNKIVNTSKNSAAARHFSFDYVEQARQNISLRVDDFPSKTDSHGMHSIFMFFPRKQIFLLEQLTGTIDVTLPTGEKLIFSRESKEIVGGVFKEGPLDQSKDKTKRSFADIRYTGKGILLRANARGQSPELGQFEKDKIDREFGARGSVDVLIMNGSTNQKCVRPKSDFWEPLDVSPIEFKFPTDKEFDSYLKQHCGFGIPVL